ncbi:AAA family ATPase [Candidatus Babeliales bacterium]|nr:AAA family ATPase [Candidatus Babeliales bacterium]
MKNTLKVFICLALSFASYTNIFAMNGKAAFGIMAPRMEISEDALKQKRREKLTEVKGQNRTKVIAAIDEEIEDIKSDIEFNRKYTVQAEEEHLADLRHEKTAELAREKAGITAQIWSQNIMSALTKPRNIVAFAGISIACYYTGKLTYKKADEMLGKPTVIEETNMSSGLSSIFGFLKNDAEENKESRIDEIVASDEIKEKISDLADILKTAREQCETMPNILFYGPPGTGKTLTARALALESGLDYVMFSGTSLTKLERGKDRVELDRIFSFAKKSERGVLVFIDEAEGFLGNRENIGTSEQSRELTQAFLDKVKKPSNKDIVFVFATNRRNSLDPAVESRISEVVRMPCPGKIEREKLFNLYLNKEVVGHGVTLDKAFISSKQQLIENMDSYIVGRDIEEFAQKLRRRANRKNNGVLSAEIAQYVVRETNKKLVSQRMRTSSLVLPVVA